MSPVRSRWIAEFGRSLCRIGEADKYGLPDEGALVSFEQRSSTVQSGQETEREAGAEGSGFRSASLPLGAGRARYGLAGAGGLPV